MVVGAGVAGVLAAIRLRAAGIADVTVYEKNDRLGGTWLENTYPGVSCDVPSHLYSYSFAPNPNWSHVFSPGDEIRAYIEDVAQRHGIAEIIRYGTEVRSLTFTEGAWDIELGSGERDRADVVIAATGVLHHPSYPDIDGLARFGGPCFHTARWDHSVPLDGRRVGVVGTGSSAVQVVTAIVDQVAELRLFQRTAQWILSVPNPPIEDEERRRFEADPHAISELRAHYARIFEDTFADVVVDAGSPQLRVLEELCRSNLDHSVADRELRERLRPDYRVACKRLIVSPSFYEAIQQPSARLVTESIVAAEPGGLRTADGSLHELDVLVLATGFRVDRFLRPIEVIGRDGVTLDEVWAERPSAYLGMSIPRFPNLFLLNGPNGPVGNFSLIEVAELQMNYLLPLLERLQSGECAEITATAEAATRFEAERIDAAQRTVWVTGCRSWYLDDRGIPAAWPWTFGRFREVMAHPDLDDFELVAA
ncbi:MAG TPA: NAD(P)/FAD-dependent oxidoreductase [Microthrixaceae bacterium]|nr:NAD(P)/FAD-dependent oxidoreductase [Microthrixaceae bacterium]